MRIVVYTALLGIADALVSPPPAGPNVRYVCVTDRPDIPAGWEPRRVETGGNPRRAARRAKIASDSLFSGADVTIWADASFDFLISPERIASEAAVLERPIVALAHPDRHRIKDEAIEVIRHGLAPAADVNRQVETYRGRGFDTDTIPQRVLTTTGLLVRFRSPQVQAFNVLWQEQLDRFTLRDQLSIDYCAWCLELRIGYLPGHYRANRFVHYNRHRHRARRVAA